jgi:hypothetical protein
MTFTELSKIIKDNNIPEDVRLMSDSGWECGETDMDGVYYNDALNIIIFTQTTNLGDIYYRYCKFPEEGVWKILSKDKHNKKYYEEHHPYKAILNVYDFTLNDVEKVIKQKIEEMGE